MQIVNENYNCGKVLMKISYYRNHDAPVNRMWRKPPMVNCVNNKRKWLKRAKNHLRRNETVKYGTGCGEIEKRLQFRNRKTKRCQCVPRLAGNRVLSLGGEKWGEKVKEEWGIDLHGSMKGLIRLRSPFSNPVEKSDGECNFIDEEEDAVQFERRLSRHLSKYEIVLPNFGTNVGSSNNNLKTGTEGSCHQMSENLMLKQRLDVIDWNMDDLKRRMEVLESRFKVKVIEDVKEEKSGDDDAGSFRQCIDEVNDEVGSDANCGKLIPQSDAIVASHWSNAAAIEMDVSDDK